MRDTDWIKVKYREKEMKRTFLRRPCTECGKYFRKTGKFSRLCETCKDNAMRHKVITKK